MSRTNPMVKKIPELLWLFTGILAFIAAFYKYITSGQYLFQYFIISILSVLMYLYRRHRRKNSS